MVDEYAAGGEGGEDAGVGVEDRGADVGGWPTMVKTIWAAIAASPGVEARRAPAAVRAAAFEGVRAWTVRE